MSLNDMAWKLHANTFAVSHMFPSPATERNEAHVTIFVT